MEREDLTLDQLISLSVFLVISLFIAINGYRNASKNQTTPFFHLSFKTKKFLLILMLIQVVIWFYLLISEIFIKTA